MESLLQEDALEEGFSEQTYRYKKGPKYSVPKLIKYAEKHGKLETIPIEKLLHNLDTMHADEPIGSTKFRQRAMSTLAYPLLVLRDRAGKYHIADGLHRLFKAKEMNKKHLRAYVIPMEHLPKESLAHT